MTMGRLLTWVAIFAVALVVALWVLAAFAHDAPRGWAYPFACCASYDCREVPDDAIGERPSGYTIAATGEVVGYLDKRLRDSPDGFFHWCSVAGKADGKTICLFVPPRAY